VFEPTKFERLYYRKLTPEPDAGMLVTVDDMREWLRSHGVQPKGTKKADIIAQRGVSE
jgi:hypothetical protein